MTRSTLAWIMVGLGAVLIILVSMLQISFQATSGPNQAQLFYLRVINGLSGPLLIAGLIGVVLTFEDRDGGPGAAGPEEAGEAEGARPDGGSLAGDEEARS